MKSWTTFVTLEMREGACALFVRKNLDMPKKSKKTCSVHKNFQMKRKKSKRSIFGAKTSSAAAEGEIKIQVFCITSWQHFMVFRYIVSTKHHTPLKSSFVDQFFLSTNILLAHLKTASLDECLSLFQHVPFYSPKKYFDLYPPVEEISVPKNRFPPTNMPDIAWTTWSGLKNFDDIGVHFQDKLECKNDNDSIHREMHDADLHDAVYTPWVSCKGKWLHLELISKKVARSSMEPSKLIKRIQWGTKPQVMQRIDQLEKFFLLMIVKQLQNVSMHCMSLSFSTVNSNISSGYFYFPSTITLFLTNPISFQVLRRYQLLWRSSR